MKDMELRQKILIVDDRKENLVALKQVLNEVDAEIVEAMNGNQALAATLQHRFAVAIVDVLMPDMDGYELAEHLRGDTTTRNMPIIFLTAVYAEEERIFRGYEVGAVDYIVKPYNPDVLRSKVRVFLDLARARAELAEKIVALTASEERYRSLVSTIPDIVYRIDADGRFTYLNEAVNSLGYTQEDLLGAHFSKIVLPADMESVARELVLPRFSNRRTAPEETPKLFDERRSGKRITVGLEVRLVPRGGGRTVPAERYAGRPDVMIVEISSSGIYSIDREGNGTVLLGTVGVIRDITERKRAEVELEQYRARLEELVQQRVKEQACLYRISEALAEPHKTVDNALQRVVGLIPSGWQYTEITCARIALKDREFTTANFRETAWKQSSDIILSGEAVGAVEVCYLEERPEQTEGPFIKEERHLVNDIARQLGGMIERERAKQGEQHLNAVLRSIRHVNQLIVHEKHRDRLIQGACDNLVTSRGFRGAWIVQVDGSSSDMKGACAGFDDVALNNLTAMFEQGHLPACCLRSRTGGEVVMTRHPAVACKDCPLVHIYVGNAAMTVGLYYNDQLYGWLGVCVPVEFAADPEETSLLAEIAGDLAFALHNMNLERQRDRYAQIVSSSSEAMALVDRGYVYLVTNPSYRRLITGDDKSLAGQRLEDVLGRATFQDVVKPGLDRCFEGQEVRFETTREVLSGAPRFVEVLYTPCLADDGSVSAVAVCIRDITERKQAEKALKEANDIINRSSSVVFTWKNQEGWPVAFVSENVERLFGYTAEEFMTGKVSYVGCIHPEDRERVAEEVTEHSSRVQIAEFTHEPYRIITKDGSEKMISDWTSIVRNEEARITHYKGIVEDITERKRLEQERQELQEQFLQAQKMESVGRLAGGIAHDFNNLLTTILGNAEMVLMDTGKDDPRSEMIQEVKRAGERASNLTRQLLAFSRKQILQPEVICLNEVVNDMEKMLGRIIREDVGLKTDLAPDLGEVEADVGQIEQVIMNLCVNARDAMPKGGTLTIETGNVELDEAYAMKHLAVTPGPYVMLAVSDTGTGMTREVKSQLFEPFFTTKEKGKGTGLGLSTIYGIVKQSNGNIWVYSEPGKGSTFKIYLPRHQGGSSGLKKAAKKEVALHGSETILLVEDDETVRNVTLKGLESYGYHVLCAQDGREALRILREYEGPIHLTLTDVVMPGMSGGDLAARAREEQQDLKFLFMSGYTDNDIVHKGFLDKGIAFLQKPFTPDHLARKVREVLEIEN